MRLRRILEFIRLTDPHDGNLSLTNVILGVAFVRLITLPNPNFVDVSALLLTLLNYNSKKIIAIRGGKGVDE